MKKDIEPPPSCYPSASAGTLVAPNRNGFPKIPAINFAALHNRQLFLDYGPRILHGKMTIHPPKAVGGAYKILVPKVDKDGKTSPAFACRKSKFRLAPTPAGTCARAAWLRASYQVCSVPSSPSQRLKRNGAKLEIRAWLSPNGTRAKLITSGALAGPRESSSSKDAC